MIEGRQATRRIPLFAMLSLLAAGSTLAAQTTVPLDPVGGWLTLSVTLGPTDISYRDRTIHYCLRSTGD